MKISNTQKEVIRHLQKGSVIKILTSPVFVILRGETKTTVINNNYLKIESVDGRWTFFRSTTFKSMVKKKLIEKTRTDGEYDIYELTALADDVFIPKYQKVNLHG